MNELDPDLLAKYARGQASEAEKLLVESWLEGDKGFADNMPGDPDIKQEIWAGLNKRVSNKRKSLNYRWYAAVAAIMLLAVGALLFKTTQQSTLGVAEVYTRYNVPKGKSVQLKLADGTGVQLAGGSTLEYPENFTGGERNVRLLKGQAFFAVSHNANKPFNVHLSGSTVRVLGTRFNIDNTNANSLQVTLTQGSIAFKTATQEQVLKPGEQLVYNKANAIISSLQAVDTAYATSWTTGALWCRDMPFKELLNRLENQYGVTFEQRGHPDINATMTGKFASQPISRILHLIENSSTLKFTARGQKHYIVHE